MDNARFLVDNGAWWVTIVPAVFIIIGAVIDALFDFGEDDD